jgi:hypothetical protein
VNAGDPARIAERVTSGAAIEIAVGVPATSLAPRFTAELAKTAENNAEINVLLCGLRVLRG